MAPKTKTTTTTVQLLEPFVFNQPDAAAPWNVRQIDCKRGDYHECDAEEAERLIAAGYAKPTTEADAVLRKALDDGLAKRIPHPYAVMYGLTAEGVAAALKK